ncbi:hypothetical protein HAZT_HAZT001323 [Hyalella azteca]|uniref:Small ribosomal subunit protein mS23 n=1 Tax=Hyalella azteca TaxID=294128 RepID=A0A6A0H002_HYAAZ|nr:28S ribosomal protein S23, mitochondrial [Hyalella azteca]KAA0194387.1 hypothetical protein HAZT_HAZT001323 [Hyalella azteca]
MAGSRRFKIGDIFTRTTGLLQSGAIKNEDKPLWYDIYEAFPPLEAPRYDRPKSYLTVKPIFYAEDVIRAKFYQKYGCPQTVNADEAYKWEKTNFCRAFIEAYQEIEAREGHLSDQELMLKAEKKLELQGIYLNKSNRPSKSNEDGDNGTETMANITGPEVPDPLMKHFSLTSIFGDAARSRQYDMADSVPASQSNDTEEEELTAEEHKLFLKSVEEMSKFGPIMDEKLTEELFADEEEVETVDAPKASDKKDDDIEKK